MKPLWAIADDLVLQAVLGNFKETARSSKYGPYGYVGDSRINKRQHDALWIAAYRVNWGPVVVTQGGLNNGAVSSSAQTHDGLDVLDISVRGHSLDQQFALVEALMDDGQVGFIRGVWDSLIKHIHMVDMIAANAHPSARDQIYAPYWGYINGGAGLEGAKDLRWHGPKRKPILDWNDSKYNPANGWRP